MAVSEKVVRWEDFELYHTLITALINGGGEALEALKDIVEGQGRDIQSNADAISDNTRAIEIMNGADTEAGSVKKQIKDAINQFATQLTDDGTVNTYAEALQYIADHGAEYTTLLGQVQNNTTDISAIREDITAIEEKNNTQDTQIQANTQSISSVQGQVDTLSRAMPTYTTADDINGLNWD